MGFSTRLLSRMTFLNCRRMDSFSRVVFVSIEMGELCPRSIREINDRWKLEERGSVAIFHFNKMLMLFWVGWSRLRDLRESWREWFNREFAYLIDRSSFITSSFRIYSSLSAGSATFSCYLSDHQSEPWMALMTRLTKLPFNVWLSQAFSHWQSRYSRATLTEHNSTERWFAFNKLSDSLNNYQ
jgi:hypothetical protein